MERQTLVLVFGELIIMIMNLKTIVSFSFFAIALLMAYLSVKTCRIRRRETRFMAGLYGSVFCAVSAQLAVIATNDIRVASVGYSFFFASIDWILFLLYRFTRTYTSSSFDDRIFKVVVRVLCALDSLALLSNMFYPFAFNVYRSDYGEDQVFFAVRQFTYYKIHLAFCYVLVACVFCVLIRKIINTPYPYWPRYYPIFFSFCLVVVWDAFFVFMHLPIDFSILGYAATAVILYYYPLYYDSGRALSGMMRYVVRDVDDMIMVFDIDDKCIYINEPAMNFLGIRDKSEVPSVIFSPPADMKLTEEDRRYGYTFSRAYETSSGKKWLEVKYVNVYIKNNKFLGSYYHILDRTEEHERYNKERILAEHDRVTGLYNAEKFILEVEKRLKEDRETEYAIVMSDIKGFKFINDIYGTGTGDELLKRIASYIQENVKEGYLYCRIGGDRFAALIPWETCIDENFFDYLPRNIKLKKDGDNMAMLHFGVYKIESRDIPVTVMLDRAMLAISAIKSNLENRISYYDDDMRSKEIWNQEISSEAERALKNGQFLPYLQAQVNSEGKVTGAEILVRWNRNGAGLLTPDKFINIFENNSMIVRIDRYMWNRACQILKSWQGTKYENLSLSVNISGRDFYFISIYDTFVGLAEKYKIDPGKLHLEITESVALERIDEKIAVINRLQSYGFIVEMDDFGSGFSSLNVLKDLPFSVLKIDMGFLSKPRDRHRSLVVLKTVVDLAKSLNMKVICEGVESEEQVRTLKDMGCNEFQGYFFAEPVSLEEFEKGLGQKAYSAFMNS